MKQQTLRIVLDTLTSIVVLKRNDFRRFSYQPSPGYTTLASIFTGFCGGNTVNSLLPWNSQDEREPLQSTPSEFIGVLYRAPVHKIVIASKFPLHPA
jgi:hypothetical protein